MGVGGRRYLVGAKHRVVRGLTVSCESEWCVQVGVSAGNSLKWGSPQVAGGKTIMLSVFNSVSQGSDQGVPGVSVWMIGVPMRIRRAPLSVRVRVVHGVSALATCVVLL